MERAMLVLRRKFGQSIVIGQNAEIVVKLLGIQNEIISVGVDAPLNVSVDRLEVLEKQLAYFHINKIQKSQLIRRLELFDDRLKQSHVFNDFSLENSTR